MMQVETQLSLFLENRAGVLGRLAADLDRHGVSIRALTIANLADHAVVRMVVSDSHKALHLLGERGVLVVTSEVLAIDMSEQVSLVTVTRRLAAAGVNIDYAYGSCPSTAGRPVFYFHVSDLTKAHAALGRPIPRRAPRRRR
jgi:hypothetical protein